MKKKLKDVCIFYSGTGFPMKYQGDSYGDLPFYKVGDIADNAMIGNSFLDTCKNYISYDIAKKIKGTIVPKNVIVFAKIGEALKLNRRCITSSNCLIDNNVMGIGCNEKYLDLKYFYFFMKNLKMEKLAESTTVPSVRKTKLEEVFIEVPAMKLQLDISKILGILQDIILYRQNQLVHMDNLVKARFVELFEKVKETCNVDYYIKELIAGKSLASDVECKNKVLKTGAASFDYFDGSQVKNLPINYNPKEEHLVHKGDIIISRMNTAELTGAAAYVWKVSNNVYIPDRLWKAVIRDGVNPIFLWNMLIQPFTKEQIQKVCSGTSGSMKNISKSDMLGIRVKKVDAYLQNDFATFVEQVNKSKFITYSHHKSIYTKPQLCCKMVIVNDFLNTKRF